MRYRSDEGAARGDHNNSNEAPGADAAPRVVDGFEKTEISALLRLLTRLANCGLDAAAKPLLHTAGRES